MDERFEGQLLAVLGKEQIRKSEPMSLHTTFRVGGPADYLVTPESVREVQEVIRLCRGEQVPYYILGNGSNLLVGDRGYRGVMIWMQPFFRQLEAEGNEIRAGAGCSLAQVAQKALELGLAGFAFAAGIPGTLGGAVVMNAGAYGGEMKDVLSYVTVLTGEGQVIRLLPEELELGYRTSVIPRKGYVVLEAGIALEPGEPGEIRADMEELRRRRLEKQPLEYPSAGSTFKRPEGHFAGKLIQEAGMKGACVGGAQVSEKHAGFVINRGDATARDILELIRKVAARVEETSGVKLEPEVKRIGEF